MRGHTLKFGDIHAELVALFQHTLATLLDEGVEARAELGHAVSQVIEAEVDVGQSVCDRGADGRQALSAETGGKGRFE